MTPSVSIIIASKDRGTSLQDTLASLARAAVPEGAGVELILVDNGSSDDTMAVMRAFRSDGLRVRVLHEPRLGKARALNRALAAAEGTVLLFTDDDVRVPKTWIQDMSTPLLRGEGDVMAGAVSLASSLRRSWMSEAHLSLLADTEGVFGATGEPSRLVGANMALHRRVFDAIREFDVELGPGALGLEEDTLVGHRLRALGFRLIGAPDVVVEHHPEPGRLARSAFLISVERLGRSGAYVDYHWRHAQTSSLRSRATVAYWTAQLKVWRIRHPRSADMNEGIETAEMRLIRRRAYHRQMQRLVGTPRRYIHLDRQAPSGTLVSTVPGPRASISA